MSSFKLLNSLNGPFKTRKKGLDITKSCFCSQLIFFSLYILKQLCFLKMTADEISSAVTALPQKDPTTREGLIREISNKISALQEANEKEQLLDKLKAVAYLGLHKDLKKMMEKKRLLLEALDLVKNYLTDVPQLAKYLYDSSEEEVKEAGLEIVRRRLGPDLEVLGASAL